MNYYLYYFSKGIYKDYLDRYQIYKSYFLPIDFVIPDYPDNNILVFGSKQYKPEAVLEFRLRKKRMILKLTKLEIINISHTSHYKPSYYVNYRRLIGYSRSELPIKNKKPKIFIPIAQVK